MSGLRLWILSYNHMYLNVHSQYSLRYGTLSIKALVEEAQIRGITQMVITDINNSTGVMEFMRECRARNIKPIGGIEFRRDKKLLYLGIARNKEGMKELNDFLSVHNLTQKELPDEPYDFKNAYIIYPFSHKAELKSNEYVGIRFDELHQLYKKDLSGREDKLVVLQPVFVSSKIGYRLHEYLRAIDLNTLITMVEKEDKCNENDMFLKPGELDVKFVKYAFMLDNTRRLMDSCTMDYPEGKIKLNRKSFTGNKSDDKDLLEKLAMEGMLYRYGSKNREALKRVKKELKVIVDLDFCTYFLITNDIIQYSMRRILPCG